MSDSLVVKGCYDECEENLARVGASYTCLHLLQLSYWHSLALIAIQLTIVVSQFFSYLWLNVFLENVILFVFFCLNYQNRENINMVSSVTVQSRTIYSIYRAKWMVSRNAVNLFEWKLLPWTFKYKVFNLIFDSFFPSYFIFRNNEGGTQMNERNENIDKG